jgi:hypothetical protein
LHGPAQQQPAFEHGERTIQAIRDSVRNTGVQFVEIACWIASSGR